MTGRAAVMMNTTAYSVARWLKDTCERGFLQRYLDPPLTEREREVAGLEGWILGIA